MTLTPRQLEVAELIYAGRTQPQIALELGIARTTVKTLAGQVRAVLRLPSYTPMALMPRAELRAGIDAHKR